VVRRPVIYAPFRGNRNRQDGKEIVGLIRLSNVFASTVTSYGDPELIYLPNNGSFGLRATEFDWHAVYGVNPNNSDHIIAPDIYNQVVKVSQNGGRSWTTDVNLTREVTKNGTLLLYEDPFRMQVTHISYDPYHPNRILVGTRDAGIILSEDGGGTWSTVPDSEDILYITNFFFMRNNIVLASSYGRGLWKIDFNTYTDPFPHEVYCWKDCSKRYPSDPETLKDPVDWSDKDVTVFLNGRINGLVLSDIEIKRITVTPGTVFKRYIGKTKDYQELNIVESEEGEGFNKLKGCLAAVQNDEIIKGVIQKENKIQGIISGKQEFKEVENKVEGIGIIPGKQEFKEGENKQDDKSKGEKSKVDSKVPYIFITTSVPVAGLPVLGSDRVIHVSGTGFKFDPKSRKNHVIVKIDGQVINKTAKLAQDGSIKLQQKIQEGLDYGKHTIDIIQQIQKIQKKKKKIVNITASSTFVKAALDDFEEEMEEKTGNVQQ
jgi:hypothetical protein